MCRQRLDARDTFPSGMEEYLSNNGWHFNKKMFAWAQSKMQDRNGSSFSNSKELFDSAKDKYGVRINADDYDCAYVFAMARADYFGSSIKDEHHLVLFVKDYLEDPDGYDGVAFTRFYADMIGKGIAIPWEDMI